VEARTSYFLAKTVQGWDVNPKDGVPYTTASGEGEKRKLVWKLSLPTPSGTRYQEGTLWGGGGGGGGGGIGTALVLAPVEPKYLGDSQDANRAASKTAVKSKKKGTRRWTNRRHARGDDSEGAERGVERRGERSRT